MWLERLCERIYDQMKHALHHQAETHHVLHLLQTICVQVTGRNSTREEQLYLQQGGLLAFEVLLHGYLMERRDFERPAGPASMLPPSGVVHLVRGELQPVGTAPLPHNGADRQTVGVNVLLQSALGG